MKKRLLFPEESRITEGVFYLSFRLQQTDILSGVLFYPDDKNRNGRIVGAVVIIAFDH